MFGDIETWPVSETFYFIKDLLEGKNIDRSIEVRFVDGSTCNISGTCRINLPISETDAINLIIKSGYRNYRELEHKLILPTVRNVLRQTANLMTAEESYSSKRPDFINSSIEQIENGLYETKDEEREITDLISGEKIKKLFKVKKLDANGNPVYKFNPLKGTGITLKNFEVKVFDYSPKVREQIAKQQEALMAVATAKAKAQEAEQNKLTIEAEGKAKVALARYEKEQEKIRAVVAAQQLKEVGVIEAEQKKAVASLAKEAAEFTKKEQILLGEGESERKRLVLAADGALDKKLDAMKYMAEVNAKAYSMRNVPTYYYDGGGAGGKGTNLDAQTAQFLTTLNMAAAKMIGLDLSIPKGAVSEEKK